jgi:hypothetical protein
VDDVFDDKQRCRFVIQLLAGVDADLFTQSPAAGTEPLGRRQDMVPLNTRQILRQTAAAMRPAFPLGFVLGCRWWRRRRRRRLLRRQIGKQQELIGVEAFAARTVQAPQQQFQAMLQCLMVAITLPQRGDQLENHALEHGRIVGQLLGGQGRLDSGGMSVAHAYLDAWKSEFVL